jgi:hypothetical protein
MFPEFDEIRSVIKKEKEKISLQLSFGVCQDYSEYQHMVGICEGLTRAEQLLDNHENSILKKEDADDFD